jgi:hypothetical protein
MSDMGADEIGTLKGLTERRAILDRFIGEHHQLPFIRPVT